MLELKDLCFSASAESGTVDILKHIDLTVEDGKFIVITGPNGGGKTTLAKVIMGLVTPTSGQILWNGEDITALPVNERAKRGIFLSFQNPLEVPGISLSNFIRSALSARTGKNIRIWDFNKELQKAMEVLDMDPSYGFRDLNVGFSGGEKKKAEILQLLLLNPSLAILDETDSGLDVDAVRTVSKGIEEYQKSKDGALLIITHSTRILESLHVDKTHVLVDGRLVAEGDGSLVDEINENGFEQFIASANEKGEND